MPALPPDPQAEVLTAADRLAARRQARRAAGRCVDCGEVAALDERGRPRARCRQHLARQVRRGQKYRSRMIKAARKQGKCLCCYKRRALEGQTKCLVCKLRSPSRPRSDWTDLGLCACGQPLPKGGKTCAACLRKKKKQYQADKGDGRCVKCHLPMAEGGAAPRAAGSLAVVCDACRGKRRKVREDRFAAGLCTQCGEEPHLPGKRFGAACMSPRGVVLATSAAQGLCKDCLAQPWTRARERLCRACARLRQRKRRHDAGLCATCGQHPYADGQWDCYRCLEAVAFRAEPALAEAVNA